MSEAKPWEDESLKGEYYKEKAKMRKPPVGKKKPTAPGATDAWGQAGQFEKRNQDRQAHRAAQEERPRAGLDSKSSAFGTRVR